MALHLQNREPIPAEIKALTATRNEPEPGENEPAERGVSGIFREPDFVLRLKVAKTYGPVENDGGLRSGANYLGRVDDIKFIVNLADHLLEHVLQRNQAEDAAKFVHH